jgi:hypothetical protein
VKEEKKHSEISPSASERWMNCSMSVTLAREAPPQRESAAADEGTLAHEFLELWLSKIKKYPESNWARFTPRGLEENDNMFQAVKLAVAHVATSWEVKSEELLVEEKVTLPHIHEELSGTADIIKIEPYGRLTVLDYKHGKGHKVKVAAEDSSSGHKKYNTQLMIYLIGVAHKYHYEFDEFNLGVIQPRAGGNKTPDTDVTLKEIKQYETFFKKGVDRVYSKNPKLFEGDWCYFCPARDYNCPLQKNKTLSKVKNYF